MATIPLNRRFHPWTDGSRFDEEAIRLLRGSGFSLDWDKLLKAKRVVVLAEGGSGKSTEFKAQCELLAKQGEFSFFASVTRVGKLDFESALSRQDRSRLTEWLDSGKPAWFFVDSVDEAKRDAVSFEDALNHIADIILGAEGRAHIVISGRHADWEFKRDLDALTAILPIHDRTVSQAASPNDFVVTALHRKKTPTAPIEKPLVVLMAPLDAAQVKSFAVGKGISNAREFLAGIDYSRLWSFASRPVDLDWLVKFWISKHAFDKLERMLDLSLSERLKETDRTRMGKMTLDLDLAMAALERVGAALVFGRRECILIPDSGSMSVGNVKALSLPEVLPDLTPPQQLELLNSAVFVPADSGLVRLHNDNEGLVRSYLASRWLRKLGDKNCPWSQFSELLFSTTYGIKAVKPSMRQTAAWLSIWNSKVAHEIVERSPMLLAQAGDPASLPAQVRSNALSAIIQAWVSRPQAGFIHHESLRRFARPDIEELVKSLWVQWKDNEAIRQLLFMMIEAGEMKGCAQIVFDTATSLSTDSLSRSLAARALATSGSPEALATYRSFLLTNSTSIDRETLWVAVNELFPTFLSVEDLISLMGNLTRDTGSHSSGIDFYGPKLVTRIDDAGQASTLLCHMMGLWLADPEDISSADFEPIDAVINTMQALAVRILDLEEATPPDEIFDLQLGLDHLARYYPSSFSRTELRERLVSKPSLRQAWLWQAVAKYAAWPKAVVQPLPSVWQLGHFAYNPNFDETDAQWLLADMAGRPTMTDRLVALSALIAVWRSTGQRAELLNEICRVAQIAPELAEKFELWTRPIELSRELQEYEADNRVRSANIEQQRASVERSWTDFADNIREDPQQLKQLTPPSDRGVDNRMFFLWNILCGLSEDVSNGSPPDLAVLKGPFDESVIEPFRIGLINHWRLAPMPILKCDRPPSERSTFNTSEFMGLGGISLEASANPRWAEKLKGDEPLKAAIYATFAFNKWPHWFPALCEAHPSTCAGILRRHIAPDIQNLKASGRRDILARLADMDSSVVGLVEQHMWELVEHNPAAAIDAIFPALKILRRATADKARLFDLVVKRADDANEPKLIAAYLFIAFSIDSQAAVDRLDQRVQLLENEDSRILARSLIPKIFGNTWSPGPSPAVVLSVDVLERLVLFAYDCIPPSGDHDRANGKVYSPDELDSASRGRERAFNQLAGTPGASAHAALLRLIAHPEFSTFKWYVAELAYERAAADSESAPWLSPDVVEFERHFKAVPRTPKDLQRLAVNRLDDLQHDLLHADFGQARTVAGLENEREVQRWFADRFQFDSSSSFLIDRESLVANEKAPDLRLHAKATSASMPIEIKITRRWALRQFEEALTNQLQGLYLRDRNDRWGILMIVHQEKRPQGWLNPTGGMWTFAEVIKHLESMAWDIAVSNSDAPQMQICAIDVSSAANVDA